MLGAFFGSSLVDRIGYRRSSVIADILSGLTVALIPLLYVTIGLQFWQLLVLVFVGGLLDIPGGTARQALIPTLASRANVRLERVNAAYATIERGSVLVGPPLAGVLIAAIDATNVLVVDALTFAISALLIGLLVSAIYTAAPAAQRYLADLLEGFHFINRNRLLRLMVIFATLSNLLATPIFAVILPYYFNRSVGNATALGLMLAAFGGGSVIGALGYGTFGPRIARRTLFIVGFAGIGVATAIVAALPPLVWQFAAMLLAGVTSGPLNPRINTVVQERTPPCLLARVFGMVIALALIASPLAVLSAGYLVELIGVQWCLVLIAAGSLLLAAGLLVHPVVHQLNDLPQQPYEPEQPASAPEQAASH